MQLAELLDIDRSHMSAIELATVGVSLDVIFKMCNILSVSPKDLFDFRHLNEKAVPQMFSARLFCSPQILTLLQRNKKLLSLQGGPHPINQGVYRFCQKQFIVLNVGSRP